MDSILYFLAGLGAGVITLCWLFCRKRPSDPFRGADPEIIARARERAKRERN